MAGPLPSTASAAGPPALFGGFSGTAGPSDFPRPSITGVRPWTSRCGLRPPSPLAVVGPPGSRARCFRACSGSQTARGPLASRAGDTMGVAFRLSPRRRHPGVVQSFRGSIPGPRVPSAGVSPRYPSRAPKWRTDRPPFQPSAGTSVGPGVTPARAGLGVRLVLTLRVSFVWRGCSLEAPADRSAQARLDIAGRSVNHWATRELLTTAQQENRPGPAHRKPAASATFWMPSPGAGSGRHSGRR